MISQHRESMIRHPPTPRIYDTTFLTPRIYDTTFLTPRIYDTSPTPQIYDTTFLTPRIYDTSPTPQIYDTTFLTPRIYDTTSPNTANLWYGAPTVLYVNFLRKYMKAAFPGPQVGSLHLVRCWGGSMYRSWIHTHTLIEVQTHREETHTLTEIRVLSHIHIHQLHTRRSMNQLNFCCNDDAENFI